MSDWKDLVSELAGKQVVYSIRAVGTPFVKIGETADLAKRLRQLQGANASRLRVEHAVEGDGGLEALLHRRFAPRRVRREWFRFEAGAGEVGDAFAELGAWRTRARAMFAAGIFPPPFYDHPNGLDVRQRALRVALERLEGLASVLETLGCGDLGEELFALVDRWIEKLA